MNKEQKDLAAFPVNSMNPGISRREYFAIMAMQGILANSGNDWDIDFKQVAKDAADAADALMNELNKQ